MEGSGICGGDPAPVNGSCISSEIRDDGAAPADGSWITAEDSDIRGDGSAPVDGSWNTAEETVAYPFFWEGSCSHRSHALRHNSILVLGACHLEKPDTES